MDHVACNRATHRGEVCCTFLECKKCRDVKHFGLCMKAALALHHIRNYDMRGCKDTHAQQILPLLKVVTGNCSSQYMLVCTRWLMKLKVVQLPSPSYRQHQTHLGLPGLRHHAAAPAHAGPELQTTRQLSPPQAADLESEPAHCAVVLALPGHLALPACHTLPGAKPLLSHCLATA